MEGSNNIVPNRSDVMDVKDTVIFLKISEAKLRRLVNERRVPYFRIDGRILFSHLSLETWIQSLIVQPDGKSAEDSARNAATTIWKEAHGG